MRGERPFLTKMAETFKEASDGKCRRGRKGDAHPSNKAEGGQATAPVASGQEAEAAATVAPAQEAEGGAGQGPDAAAAFVGRVLEADETRHRKVLIDRMRYRFRIGNVEHASRPLNCLAAHSVQNRGGASLVVRDVTVAVNENLIPGPAMRPEAELIRLRPRASEEGRFFTE